MARIPSLPFVIVDGSSYLFRAYHALPPLMNSKGQPTGAIFGVINMLRKLMAEFKPTHMVVVFDAKDKTFRHTLYEAYKANRVVMPDELTVQIAPLHELIQALGLPLLIMPGTEADDIIATLAKRAEAQGRFTLISTGDKDFAQLVNENIFLINTMSNDILDREGVINKFGVPPERIVDYLALIGDSSDNIRGVDKVGPKTAVKWLEAYGSLNNIIERASEIGGKVGENLKTALEYLPLNVQLVTVQDNVDIAMGFDEMVLAKPHQEKLKTLYEELEFKTWLKMLEQQILVAPKLPIQELKNSANNAYQTILSQDAFVDLQLMLEKAELVAFDIETTSLNVLEAQLVGLSFSVAAHTAVYLPVAHDYEGAPLQLDRDWVLQKLKPWLENPAALKVGHNLKYDASVLANYGIHLQGIGFDTMLESYVLNSTRNRHDLDTLAEQYLNHKTIRFEDVAGKGAKQITFNKVDIQVAAPYAAEDADITLQLHQHLWPLLEGQPGPKRIFEALEIPLIPVLSLIERCGVKIDDAKLKAQSESLAERLMQLELEAHSDAGIVFNLNSPKQLQEILYQRMNLPVIEKTPTGQPSTAEPVLQELAQSYLLPAIILEYRSLSKLKSTYTDRLPEQINARTGRVHTSYHQAVTATGRLSSSDPNLQNIPIRTEEGRKIRLAFICEPGYKIVSADYSQIELRIMAHLSQDGSLLRAFSNDVDVHRATAAEVFGVALDEVSDDQRRSAKAINFGLMYGMSAFGLARQLGIARDEAQNYIDSYFVRFPGVKKFMDDTRMHAKEKGYVETVLGRRLYLPDLNARNGALRKAAERAAINAPMQGTAADIIKLAMIYVDEWLIQKNIDARMIMQVHDELVFEVKQEIVEEFMPKIQELMSQALILSVPLLVGIGYADNWEEAH